MLGIAIKADKMVTFGGPTTRWATFIFGWSGRRRVMIKGSVERESKVLEGRTRFNCCKWIFQTAELEDRKTPSNNVLGAHKGK
jgi:hypothetical protein